MTDTSSNMHLIIDEIRQGVSQPEIWIKDDRIYLQIYDPVKRGGVQFCIDVKNQILVDSECSGKRPEC